MTRSHSRPLWLLSVATAGAVLVSGCEVNVFNRGGTQAVPAGQSAPAPQAGQAGQAAPAGQAAGQAGAQPTTGARTSAQASRPEVKVRKGTITDSIKVLGRVISSQEADLYFKTTGRLRGLLIESGQQVKV